ncbi:MAG: triose-phosphate isomerase [bacterium]|nr:triose-phosphate isomerase [bacterium]
MKLIVGNWKMYPRTFGEAKKIVVRLKSETKKVRRAKIVICPPMLFVYPLIAFTKNSSVSVGAQNAFMFDEGAYTGETSPASLRRIGATHVIVGHSERRALGEDDGVVAKKAITAAKNGLAVILCVGEAARDEGGAYFTEVGKELRASLFGFPKSEIKRLAVAYEPIWAIGASAARAATPEDFREMSVFIRRNLVDRFGKKDGFAIPILYGGSVDEKNAVGFLGEGGADGLLVGRASLDPKKFSAIIHAAAEIR